MDNQQPSVDMNILTNTPKRNYGFIYCYTSPSGKKYVGQTVQTIFARAKGMNGKGYKRCGVFYKAIQKYGFENFKVEILEEAPIELLDEKEQEWIDFLNTQVPNGYNITEGGSGHSKKVYQYDCESGKLIAEFPSLTEAARVNKVNTIQHISNCLNKKAKTAHGYIWDFERFEQVIPQSYFPNDKKVVYAYNLNGEFVKKFDSIADAATFAQGGRNDIKKVIKGELKYSKGYIWRDYYSDKIEPVYTTQNGGKPVAQIDLTTGKIVKIFSSQSEAARALGLSRPTGISKCCNGKAKSCAGYRWEFYEGSTTIGPENPQE